MAELRRLYLTARGHLRDMLGDEAIERFGLAARVRTAYHRPSSGRATIVTGADIGLDGALAVRPEGLVECTYSDVLYSSVNPTVFRSRVAVSDDGELRRPEQGQRWLECRPA